MGWKQGIVLRTSCALTATQFEREAYMVAHSVSLIGAHIGACDEICTTLLAQTHEHAHKDMCNTSDDAL